MTTGSDGPIFIGGPDRCGKTLVAALLGSHSRIAIPAGAPVVPVGIWGTQEVWPRGGLERASLLRRHTLALVYGTALVPHPGEPPSEFRERYRGGLEEVVARARTLAEDPT